MSAICRDCFRRGAFERRCPACGSPRIVAHAELVYLNISVASAMKMIISGGAALPWKNETLQQLTLLDHVEAWLKRGEIIVPPVDEKNSAESN